MMSSRKYVPRTWPTRTRTVLVHYALYEYRVYTYCTYQYVLYIPYEYLKQFLACGSPLRSVAFNSLKSRWTENEKRSCSLKNVPAGTDTLVLPGTVVLYCSYEYSSTETYTPAATVYVRTYRYVRTVLVQCGVAVTVQVLVFHHLILSVGERVVCRLQHLVLVLD